MRDSIFSNYLIFANEAQGSAYKACATRANKGRVSILCLDGFTIASAGYYGGGAKKKTQLNGMDVRRRVERAVFGGAESSPDRPRFPAVLGAGRLSTLQRSHGASRIPWSGRQAGAKPLI